MATRADGGQSRRGHGDGGLRWDAGRQSWEWTIEAGIDPVTGQRRRFKGRAKLKTKALADMRSKAEQVRQGAVPTNVTVGELLDSWLATVVDGRVDSDNTRAAYRQIVDLHLRPALGRMRLDKLTPELVDKFLAGKAKDGYARTYIGRMRTLLADALRQAERRGIIVRNAAELSNMPKTKATNPRRSFTANEARALLVAARGEERRGEWRQERLEALVVVGLNCGLRPGELCGFLWENVDLDADTPTLTVAGSLKRTTNLDGKGYTLHLGAVKRSTAGRRTIALTPAVVTALKAHKERQAVEREVAGAGWTDHGLVFCAETGGPLDPSNLRRTVARIAKRAGIDADFPYAMRHSAASLLLDRGVPLDQVADLLGDDPMTLLRHYRHQIRPVATAALAMADVLAGSADVL